MPEELDDKLPKTTLSEADVEALIAKLEERAKNPPPRPKPGEAGYEIDQLINSCMTCKRDRRDGGEPCNYCKPLPKYPQKAPAGQVFVCGACGKTSNDLYGDPSSGWDESCMLNAVLCYADRRDEKGLYVAVKGY